MQIFMSNLWIFLYHINDLFKCCPKGTLLGLVISNTPLLILNSLETHLGKELILDLSLYDNLELPIDNNTSFVERGTIGRVSNS